MTINRKIYVLNAVIWIGGLAIATALVWRLIAWIVYHWKLPGLP